MKKKIAVFLDRDGTIIKEVNNLRSLSQLRLIPGAAKGIKTLNNLGVLVIIITNQPVIARGWIKPKDLNHIHNVLLKRLSKKGAKIDAIYYCPHHPEANLKKYRKKCSCRKPNIGLIKKAAKDFPINFKKSFFIGDGTRDILTGKNARLKTILVKTGRHPPTTQKGENGISNISPDFEAKNLLEVSKIIKKLCKPH